MQPTLNTSYGNVRTQSARFLKKHLAAVIDLHAQARRAHCNVHSRSIIADYQFIDQISFEVAKYSDLIAKCIGGRAGAVEVAAEHVFLGLYSPDIADEHPLLVADSGTLVAFDEPTLRGASNAQDPDRARAVHRRAWRRHAGSAQPVFAFMWSELTMTARGIGPLPDSLLWAGIGR